VTKRPKLQERPASPSGDEEISQPNNFWAQSLKTHLFHRYRNASPGTTPPPLGIGEVSSVPSKHTSPPFVGAVRGVSMELSTSAGAIMDIDRHPGDDNFLQHEPWGEARGKDPQRRGRGNKRVDPVTEPVGDVYQLGRQDDRTGGAIHGGLDGRGESEDEASEYTGPKNTNDSSSSSDESTEEGEIEEGTGVTKHERRRGDADSMYVPSSYRGNQY
jgi:hypothetical protein